MLGRYSVCRHADTLRERRDGRLSTLQPCFWSATPYSVLTCATYMSLLANARMTFAFLLQGIWSLQHIAHGSTTSPTSINASIVVIANRLDVCFVVSILLASSWHRHLPQRNTSISLAAPLVHKIPLRPAALPLSRIRSEPRRSSSPHATVPVSS